MCNNTVTQYVPKGWGYKGVEMKCGNTGIHGNVLLCEQCENKQSRQYPQGWRHSPGDTCRHGTYIGDSCGPDILCLGCELDED